MLDLSLGILSDVGGYDGPLLDGKPLHSGHCEDTTYGCRRCNSAATTLTDAQLDAIGWPKTTYCSWCHKDVPSKEIRGLRPWDEPSCYYEVCRACKDGYDKDFEREFAEELGAHEDVHDEPDYQCACSEFCEDWGEGEKGECTTYLAKPGKCTFCKNGHVHV